MLKIAIDCRMIGSGGIGSYISEIIPYLLKENECLLIGSHEQCAPFLRLQNVEFCYCDIKPFSRQELFNFPKDVLKKIHSYDYYFTPYCNIPGGIKLPVFSTIHDIVFLDVKGLTGLIGRLGRKWFYKRAIKLSDVVFTVSEFSKERLISRLNCKKPVEITYNSAPAYLKTPLDIIPERKDQILFVGNIKKHKGLKSLLDAYLMAKEKGFSSKLIITGNAENFRTGDAETSERLSKINPDLIEFTGKISNEELKKLYASSKLLVQPSLYEGFGMPPLEAMTVGTPVLISDIPVFKEIYKDFPVQYFECNNPDDLCKKLLNADYSPVDISDKKDFYSYERSANIIQNAISSYK